MGNLSLRTGLLLAGVLIVVAVVGHARARLGRSIAPALDGVVPEMLVGLIFCNTLLFALVLAMPLGIGVDLLVVAVAAALLQISTRRAQPTVAPRPEAERAGLVCIVACGVVATASVRDQQPIASGRADDVVAFARAQKIDVVSLHPDPNANWRAAFLDTAAFACDGYRVFALAPQPGRDRS